MKIPVTEAKKPTRRKIMETVRHAGARKAVRGATSANSQNFLYDEEGLPK
jgi:hypothetical protein